MEWDGMVWHDWARKSEMVKEDGRLHILNLKDGNG
jgi:hypothetical protein